MNILRVRFSLVLVTLLVLVLQTLQSLQTLQARTLDTIVIDEGVNNPIKIGIVPMRMDASMGGMVDPAEIVSNEQDHIARRGDRGMKRRHQQRQGNKPAASAKQMRNFMSER